MNTRSNRVGVGCVKEVSLIILEPPIQMALRRERESIVVLREQIEDLQNKLGPVLGGSR